MHNYTKINNTRTQFANLRLFLVMIIEIYDNIKFSIYSKFNYLML